MKTPWLALLLALIPLGLFPHLSAAETKHYQIDPVHSSIDFKIRHLGISWVRGSFSDFSGTVALDEAQPENSSIEVSVKVASINTNSAKRDGHLKSDEFFDAEKYPIIHFKSTSIRKTGQQTYEVTGHMTLHGITRPITVTLTDSGEVEAMGKTRRGAEISDFAIQRTDYGINESVGLVGNEVYLYLAFSCIRK